MNAERCLLVQFVCIQIIHFVSQDIRLADDSVLDKIQFQDPDEIKLVPMTAVEQAMVLGLW